MLAKCFLGKILRCLNDRINVIKFAVFLIFNHIFITCSFWDNVYTKYIFKGQKLKKVK